MGSSYWKMRKRISNSQRLNKKEQVFLQRPLLIVSSVIVPVTYSSPRCHVLRLPGHRIICPHVSHLSHSFRVEVLKTSVFQTHLRVCWSSGLEIPELISNCSPVLTLIIITHSVKTQVHRVGWGFSK